MLVFEFECTTLEQLYAGRVAKCPSNFFIAKSDRYETNEDIKWRGLIHFQVKNSLTPNRARSHTNFRISNERVSDEESLTANITSYFRSSLDLNQKIYFGSEKYEIGTAWTIIWLFRPNQERIKNLMRYSWSATKNNLFRRFIRFSVNWILTILHPNFTFCARIGVESETSCDIRNQRPEIFLFWLGSIL